MCLSIPSKVTQIDNKSNTATVETMGVSRDTSLELMESGSVKVGDYVLLHVGFIMNKIDEESALSSLEAYKEILEVLEKEELEKVISDSDNCSNA